MEGDPEYIAWERQAPSELRADVISTLDVYRYALFGSWLAHRDATRLLEAPLGQALADQLVRAADSTSARLAEGYSRFHVRDRTRYYEFALGSARETRDHCVKAIPILGPEIGRTRIALHAPLAALPSQGPRRPPERRTNLRQGGARRTPPLATGPPLPIPHSRVPRWSDSPIPLQSPLPTR